MNETSSRRRRGNNAAAAIATIALWTAGCTHDAPATTPPANVLARPVVDPGDLLELIPATASAVFRIDGNQLRGNPIYTKYLAAELASTPELAMVEQTCGFDPIASITSLTLATIDSKGHDDDGVELVVRGIPRDRAIACLPKLRGRAPANAQVRLDGDTWIVKTSNPLPYGVRFLGDDVALVIINEHASQAATDALLAGRATTGLPSSATFMGLHTRLHAATSWLVTTPPSIFELLPEKGITAAFGAFDFSDGVTIDGTMRFDTADNAQRAEADLKRETATAGMYVSRLDIATNGSELTVGVTIERDKLVALLAAMTAAPPPRRAPAIPVPPGP